MGHKKWNALKTVWRQIIQIGNFHHVEETLLGQPLTSLFL